MKGIGISVNPPPANLDDYDGSTIVYNLKDGRVHGGSRPNRIVKRIQRDNKGFYPLCIYKMELDLLNRILVMECNEEKIVIDPKIGDFEYSPVVIFGHYNSHSVQVSLV